MRMLHTKIWRRLMAPVEAEVVNRGLDVELAPLGSGPGDALLAGTALTEEEFLEAEAAGVRWVQMLTVGMEDVMSPALEQSPVLLTTVGGIAVDPMAEFVFARILAHAKRFDALAEMQAQHRWEPMTMLGSLGGATLTVVGLGPVGARIAELGRAFRMQVIGVRRRPGTGAGACDEVAGVDSLQSVLARTDYLVLALPLTEETRGLIGGAELDAMKPGAVLVNVGRGPLVDEQALLAAVATGRVHAALDVVVDEPLPADSPLWDAPGVVVSPHCSSITSGLFDELAEVAVDNIARFLAGKPLRNQVDKRAGYPVRA